MLCLVSPFLNPVSVSRSVPSSSVRRVCLVLVRLASVCVSPRRCLRVLCVRLKAGVDS